MTSSDAELFRIEGNRHFGLKQFEQAIIWYSKALDEQRSALVYSNRAQAYLELQRNADAFLDAREALHLAPDNFKALFRCGLALFRLGRLEFAKEMVEKCAALEPENKHAKIMLNDIQQVLKRRNANKNAVAGPPNSPSIISGDIWRQVFTFLGPAERPNVGQLNHTIWSTFWDHHFERGKKRLTRHLVYVRNKNGKEQFLVKETFGKRLYILPIANMPAPPNIVGLDLCIEAQPGKKLLAFLTQNKVFLSDSTLKFEGFSNFITTIPNKIKRQFMDLFEDCFFTAIWIQEESLFKTFCYPNEYKSEQCANIYADRKKFVSESKSLKHLAIYGTTSTEFHVSRIYFLLKLLHNFGLEEETDQLRLLSVDDDWLPDDYLPYGRFGKKMPLGSIYEEQRSDPDLQFIQVALDWFNIEEYPRKYAVSMQKMHRNSEVFKENLDAAFILQTQNKMGEVFDLRMHKRNGMDCALLRRCPLEDLEKEYMHPDVLFASPKKAELCSRIMVTGITNHNIQTPIDLLCRTTLPAGVVDSTICKSEWQAYLELKAKKPELKISFEKLPNCYYFDFIQREWFKREQPYFPLEIEQCAKCAKL